MQTTPVVVSKSLTHSSTVLEVAEGHFGGKLMHVTTLTSVTLPACSNAFVSNLEFLASANLHTQRRIRREEGPTVLGDAFSQTSALRDHPLPHRRVVPSFKCETGEGRAYGDTPLQIQGTTIPSCQDTPRAATRHNVFIRFCSLPGTGKRSTKPANGINVA